MKNKDLKSYIILESALVILAAICGFLFFGIGAGSLCLLIGAGLTALFAYYTKRRYRKLEELNEFLVRVLAGDSAPEILDQEEGELSILRTISTRQRQHLSIRMSFLGMTRSSWQLLLRISVISLKHR